jgi:hypothetical protein
MGYSGPNGRALKSISALIKYGFLEKHGEDGLRVSERAITILYPDDEHPELREKELLLASREPDLFDEIFSRWETRPTETSLEAFLIRKGFNVNAISEVTRAFYETYDLISELSNSADSQEKLNHSDKDNQETIEAQKSDNTVSVASEVNFPSFQSTGNFNITKPIFDFETVQVNTIIDNQEDLRELISRLEKILPMLPNKLSI